MGKQTKTYLKLGLQILLVLLSLLSLTSARSDLRLEFPGPYCQKIDKCCHSRQDDCATPIAGKIFNKVKIILIRGKNVD